MNVVHFLSLFVSCSFFLLGLSKDASGREFGNYNSGAGNSFLALNLDGKFMRRTSSTSLLKHLSWSNYFYHPIKLKM